MNFLSLRPSTPPSQLYLRVFGPSTSVPDLAWQVRRQFTTRIIAPLPDPVGVSRPASKVMESRQIFLPFSGKKGRESFLRLAVEKKRDVGSAASLESRILSFVESAALSHRLFAEFTGMRLEVVPFGYSLV